MKTLRLFCVGLFVLTGCWNETFEPHAWKTGDDDVRCAMGASLEKQLVGMHRSDVEAMLDIDTKGKPEFIDNVGLCMLGCHGGGAVFLRITFQNDHVISAIRIRS